MRDELIARVVLHSGLSEEQAGAAVLSVLAGLRGELGQPEAEALADQLPDDFAQALRRGHYSGGESLVARVASAEQGSPAQAIEHIASVCRALTELLPGAALEPLRRALPPETAAFFEPPAPAAAPPHLRPHRNTLAEGRPGSWHPLSEARPRGAQADSVVESDNPHADTKLSSSRGLTQEREQESIAAGRPGGGARSLADTDHD